MFCSFGSTAASLEIFEFNPGSQESAESARRGSVAIDHRIYKLAWSPHVAVQGRTTNAGALVAGVENGIVIYSADSLLSGKDDVVIKEMKVNFIVVFICIFLP